MAGRSTRWSTGLLLLACAGLGTVVALELSEGVPIAPAVTAAPPEAGALDAPGEPLTFEPPPRRRFQAIGDRPLFSPSRRPWEPPVEDTPVSPEAAAPPPAPALALVGVLLTAQSRAALLQGEEQGALAWVREGEEWSGWHLDLVEQDRVHLRAGEREEVVELRTDAAVAATPRALDRRADRRNRRKNSEDAEEPKPAD
jgi:hypothetical protein